MTENGGSSAVRQEPQDISGKTVVVVGALVISVGIAAVAIMAWMLDERREAMQDSTAVPVAALGRGASPIEHSRIERTALGLKRQEEERRRLQEWGWVEKGKIARIPIDEAGKWLLHDAKKGRIAARGSERKPPVGKMNKGVGVDPVAGAEGEAGALDAGIFDGGKGSDR